MTGLQTRSNPDASDASQLVHRRQFVLGPRALLDAGTWSTTKVAYSNFTLQVHPDLMLTVRWSGPRQLILLGDVIDPERPESTNLSILQSLDQGWPNGCEEHPLPDRFGGRYLLIVAEPNATWIFPDACAFRQVFYTDATHEETWCASQATLISKALRLRRDESFQREFAESSYCRTSAEVWYPGEATPFSGVRRLLPNHALDLRRSKALRVWPSGELPRLGYRKSVERVATLLAGSIAAGRRRFSMALPITAGFDSRVVLAACRGMSSEIHCYTARYHGMPIDHRDIKVPGDMLSSIGCAHNVIQCPARMSENFRNAYSGNTEPFHEEAGAIAEGLLAGYPAGYVSLSGHAAEIGRCIYYRDGRYPDSIDARALVKFAGMDVGGQANIHAERQFASWLADAQRVEQKSGVKVLDLFYWEQRVSSWAANGHSQWDVVHDRLPIFSCREVLAIMLSLPVDARTAPHDAFHRSLIEHMWPELLRYPINPASGSTLYQRARSKIIAHLKALRGRRGRAGEG